MPFIVEVQADDTGTWANNRLMYRTEKGAKAAGKRLFQRWFGVREWRVVEINVETAMRGGFNYDPHEDQKVENSDG